MANIDFLSDSQLSAFIAGTAKRGAIDEFEAIVARKPELLFHKDPGEGNLYHVAAGSRQPHFIRHLRQHHPELDPTASGNNGFTPVHRAAWSVSPACVDALLEDPRVSLDVVWDGGHTPLAQMPTLNQLPLFKRLLAAGADPDFSRDQEMERVKDGEPVGEGFPNPATEMVTIKGISARDAVRQASYGDFEEVLEAYDRLPRIAVTPALTKADLLQPVMPHGHCPLEHPMLWQRYDTWSAILQQKGEALTLDDLLQPTPDGANLLSVAIAARKGQTVMDDLREHAQETLNPHHMVDAAGKIQPWVETLVSEGFGAYLFNSEIWRGHSPMELTKLVRQLPSELQEQLPGQRQLIMQLQRSQESEQRGRG